MSSDPFADAVRAAFRRGDNNAVLAMAGTEVDRARAAGEPAGEVEGLYAQSRVALRGGDLPGAETLAGQALDVAIRSGDHALEERPRHVLAAVARLNGDYPLAKERYLASIALNRALGRSLDAELHNLAFTELHLGNLSEARELFRAVRDQDGSLVPYLCVAAAAVASAEGDHARAARMLGLATAAFAAIGQVPDPDDALELSSARTLAEEVLGVARFAEE
ncbi:tetratricopeptide repeat protein [Actinoplanes sp. NBRC 101535]|uniref:tetratricopeptide repeat protein n=1 Tax=Actinoplanes sp. NBRC 101535 TaxID=3032196 RepID=UPI0024A16646|nr:tetratricopeptide repeat protein [Actinoplanes sp. NBRC 101535]GLY00661.1 hypothetical protein Acsp01_10400 [Actinoplanes sp. NBRC 101535]